MKRALAAALLTLALASCSSRPRYSGWSLDPVLPAPAVRLATAAGDLSLAEPGGRLSVVTFGYTSCPDVCPATLADWRKVRPRLGADTSLVRFVFVSVDWKHDTPATAAEFARRFDPAFIGAVADSASLALLLPAFRADARYDTLPGGGQAVSHTDYTYIVDDSARVALSYDFATTPQRIAGDLRTMIRAHRVGRGS